MCHKVTQKDSQDNRVDKFVVTTHTAGCIHMKRERERERGKEIFLASRVHFVSNQSRSIGFTGRAEDVESRHRSECNKEQRK